MNDSDIGGCGDDDDDDKSLLYGALVGRDVVGGPPDGRTQRGHVRDAGEPLLVTASG